jgi:hypothetical protein
MALLGASTCRLDQSEWDGLVPDEDARWLFDAFEASPIKRDIKISRGTHLMHLEVMRAALYREANAFLLGEDQALSLHPSRREDADGATAVFL